MDLINDHENYEDDSLEDEQDVIEIPESPMTVDMNNDNYSIRDCFVSKQQEMKNSLFTNVSDHPGLPSDIIVIDQPGKIIDKRNRIRMKSSTFVAIRLKANKYSAPSHQIK
ncbi:Geranylgeranyl transferase type-1 subunit beta, variant 2 [Dermatophagoides farinae]|uniref:Geranylgeranyl transferase type-1 subunit beta, variant 2 n=1 Tax=Dermatophagoides farinae TaxID=6954 RepID=A0A922HRH1_DERFA|nr:Geranylgeranyl transferase type-1 subunit beta, variant 2 [Dermatophagoides farinae]